jgi:1-acyl-sn-glycerol-3-phosphate acyltransferase
MDRIDTLYRIGETFVSAYFRLNYSLHFEGTLPRNEPYVLLPKHQKLIDIPIEGHFIRRRTGRLANYVMRGFPFPLGALFTALGGIEVARPKDYRRGKITEEEFRQLNQRATERVLNCLERGEPVVIHPEGTRKYKELGNITIRQGSILAKILEEQKYRATIQFIPMGIEYDRSHIRVRAGQPIHTGDHCELEERLKKELPKLSNIQP